MKILFDQGTPVPLRKSLTGHEVHNAFEMGWSQLSNGDLIREAESANYDVLITTDQNLKYQQSLPNRSIAILVLMSTSWPKIQGKADEITNSLAAIEPGDYVEIAI